ncbi:MAG: class I SAM-dependent methyltransferase [Deltaproteobacteria bacterium]|nr:class I SAM-dependent methyltransferase [Deltaproteobacteria bacterium]
MSNPSYYRPSFDILAPLYDLGICIIGLLFGGEKNLRGSAIEALNPVPECRVLEICCGTATLSLMAAEKGAEAYGIDISRGMLNVAWEKAQRQKAELRLVRSDVLSIPFKEKAFDGVIASMGLHEIPFDAVRTIFKEVKRVLKDDGRFVIFDYYKGEGFAGFIQNIFFIFAEHEPAREFIKADLQKELRDAGFKKFQRRLLAGGVLQVISVTS